MSRITRELAVELSEIEKRAKGEEISRALEQYDAIEAEKKDMTSELTKKMKGLRIQWQKLARQVREGKEFRQVDCKEEHEHRTGTVNTVRCDTGEVIETRAMTSQERQAPLFPIGGGKKAAKPKVGNDSGGGEAN